MGKEVYDPKTEAEALGVSLEAYLKVFYFRKDLRTPLVHLTAV